MWESLSKPAEVTMSLTVEVTCSLCNPDSTLPHAIQVTRIRVNNLCCAGEEKIIRTCLENITGVESIAVNIVGRYAVIKHCPVPCCASPDRIVEILNEKYLGASIQELAEGEEDSEADSFDWLTIHMALIVLLFVAGLICHFLKSLATVSMWLYLVSVMIGIWPILYSTTIALLVRHTIDIHVLMIIAIIGSLIAEDFFDASLLVALFLCAEALEQLAMTNVRQAVKHTTAGTIPKNANLADGTKVETGLIKKGMVICVRAGEMILADGVVVKGEGVVDEAALSGECIPIHKAVGDEVRSGTIVQNGFMEVRASKGAAQSTLQRLRQEVQDVQADRGQYAKMVDQFALYWTPAVLIAAAGYMLAAGFTGGDWDETTHRGMLILVLACPCSIVVSAPIPAICAIANAAKHGVLIRGSSVVEKMAVVDTVALDKTGTLTKGFFKVTARLALTSDAEEAATAMACAAAVEEKSTHPLADAVVSEHVGCITEMAENALPPVRKVEVIDGVGVSGWVEVDEDWKYCVVGNERILKRHGGSVRATKAQEAQLEQFVRGAANSVCLFVAVEDELMLCLSLADQLRPESERFLRALEGMHLQPNMLTGDAEGPARHFSAKLGIPPSACHFRLLSENKLQWIRAMQHHHLQPQRQPALPLNPLLREDGEDAQGVQLQDMEAGTPVPGAEEEEDAALVLKKQKAPASGCCAQAASDARAKSPTSPGGYSAVAAVDEQEALKEALKEEEGVVALAGKVSVIEENKFIKLAGKRRRSVMMVGDGINDSTALAAADVGVAMGAGGSAMAVTAADVVLMSENLLLIPGAVVLCQVARRAIIENCVFSIGIKILAIVLALMGYLEFWHAILIDLGTLLVVVVNGVKILQVRAFSRYEAAAADGTATQGTGEALKAAVTGSAPQTQDSHV